MTWLLIAYNTDSRYRTDIRYRAYTTSEKKAEAFRHIPKIQFSDSGHGIVFAAYEHTGPKLPPVTTLAAHVRKHMP